MAGRITLSHYGTIIACGVLFFIYIVFPAPFRLVSENLFLLVYTPVSVSESGAVSASVNREDTHIPLFVLARPPQTPYDFFITTAPEQPSVSDEKNVLFTLVEPSDSPIEYVYTEFGTPVGFVNDTTDAVYRIALFSSPVSEELFSVNGYVTVGRGNGSGSFSLHLPTDITAAVGTPIIHQRTGKVAGKVLTIENVPENTTRIVTAAVLLNPLRTAVLFIETDDIEQISDADIDASVESAERMIESYQEAAEKPSADTGAPDEAREYDDGESSIPGLEEL